MNSLLKLIEYLFYLMILLYLVGKSFEIITVLIDILFIIYLVKNKDITLSFFNKYKQLIKAFLILIGYFLIQSFISNDVSVSIKHSVGMVRFVILFFAIVLVFNTKEKIKNVIYISFISLFAVNIDSLYQYIIGFDLFGKPMYSSRLTAWNDGPVVSLYSGEFFGLLVASVFILKDKYKKIAVISLLLFITIFFLSGNRSPIVALFSTVFIVGLLSGYKKQFIGLFAVLGIVFSLTLFNDKLLIGYKGIINPTSNTATSGRHQIYNTSIEIIKENPFLGIGSGNFRYDFQSYYSKLYDENSEDKITKFYFKNSPYHPHSIFLDILISYGIIGMILFMYVLYHAYVKFIKNNSLGLISSIGFIYCITPLQFAKSLSQSNWQFYTFLGLIFLALISNYETIVKKEGKDEIQ